MPFVYLFWNPEFQNQNSDFSILQQRNLIKIFPTIIFGIGNGSGILLLMGVPEIGTKNRNSQPRATVQRRQRQFCSSGKLGGGGNSSAAAAAWWQRGLGGGSLAAAWP
jgi:hypothetical protein